MSDKWEVVGKAKKSKSFTPSTKDNTDKRSSGISSKKPTIEEIRREKFVWQLDRFDVRYYQFTVPKYALKNIRTENVNKENKKPNGLAKSVKKVEKTVQPTPQPKVKGVSIPRKPQNIEAAFEQFNSDDLYAEIEAMKENYPKNHLVWLKGVS